MRCASPVRIQGKPQQLQVAQGVVDASHFRSRLFLLVTPLPVTSLLVQLCLYRLKAPVSLRFVAGAFGILPDCHVPRTILLAALHSYQKNQLHLFHVNKFC